MGQLQRDFSTWKRQQIITKYVQLCSWLYLWHDYCFKCHLDIGWFMNHKLSYSLDLSVSVLSCHASFFGFFELYSISVGEFREQQKASSPGGFYWEEGEWQHTLEIRQETATLHVIRVISEAAVTVWSSTSILHTLCREVARFLILFDGNLKLKVKMRLMELISFNHRALHFMRLSLCITKHEKAKRKVVRCVIWISARIFDDDSMQIEGKNSRRTARG